MQYAVNLVVKYRSFIWNDGNLIYKVIKKMGRLDVRGISEDVLVVLKEDVKERYGKLHTVMGQEVEKALRAYLGMDMQIGNTHTHQKQEEKTEQKEDSKEKIPKGIAVGKTRAERINNVGEMLMYGSGEISDVGIQRLITSQQVGDERVIESYIQTMKLRGWLVTAGRNTGMAVLRSTISKALDMQLPKETPEKMMRGYEIPKEIERNERDEPGVSIPSTFRLPVPD